MAADLPLVRGQRARLVEDLLRDRQLAQVVQGPRDVELGQLGPPHPEAAPDGDRQLRHVARVVVDGAVLDRERLEDRVQGGVGRRLHAAPRHLRVVRGRDDERAEAIQTIAMTASPFDPSPAE